jgi:hypothetical protein
VDCSDDSTVDDCEKTYLALGTIGFETKYVSSVFDCAGSATRIGLLVDQQERTGFDQSNLFEFIDNAWFVFTQRREDRSTNRL